MEDNNWKQKEAKKTDGELPPLPSPEPSDDMQLPLFME